MAALRPAGDFDRSYEQDMSVLRKRWQYVVLFVGLAALFLLPAYSSESTVSFVNRVLIAIVAVQGLNILTGYTGQISLGQAAFMTVGGYASTLLVTQLGWNFFFALPVAALSAGVVGLIFGLPSLRVKGFYLVMATLSAQFIIPWITRNIYGDILHGAQGLNVPVPIIKLPVINNLCFFGTQFDGELGACVYRFATSDQFIHISLVVVILSTIVAHNISRSRLGRALVSIRDNDLAAELLGIDPFAYKLKAFFIAAVFAGAAGAMLAHNLRHINSVTVNLTDSILFMGMLVVGGLGTSLGPIFGATLVILLEEIATVMSPWVISVLPDNAAGATAALRPLIFGLALIVFLIFEPRGLAHRWKLTKAAWRMRPFSR